MIRVTEEHFTQDKNRAVPSEGRPIAACEFCHLGILFIKGLYVLKLIPEGRGYIHTCYSCKNYLTSRETYIDKFSDRYIALYLPENIKRKINFRCRMCEAVKKQILLYRMTDNYYYYYHLDNFCSEECLEFWKLKNV